MVLAAGGLWYAMNMVDTYILQSTIQLWWVYSGGIDGARAILSSIASSTITVAGTVFSITIVVLSLASRQFGTRILRSFIADRGNQIVLGTFLGTFIYCLLMLGTLRGIGGTGSIPQAGVMLSLILALTSIGVLVYFIHHISSSIQSHNVVAAVTNELMQTIERVFPEKIEKDSKGHGKLKDGPDFPENFHLQAYAITSSGSGYIQEIDLESLIGLAVKRDLVIHIQHRAGHFIGRGSLLVLASPREHIDEKIISSIRKAFILGVEQTAEQDVGYSIDRLVQIAVSALSPSYNDPFTVINYLDWLGVALCDLANRKIPSPNHYDSGTRIRVIEKPILYTKFLEIAFNKLHHAVQDHTDVITHILDTILVIGRSVARKEDREALLKQANIFYEAANRQIRGSDLEQVDEHYRAVVKSLVISPPNVSQIS